jgi:hypothetical protein
VLEGMYAGKGRGNQLRGTHFACSLNFTRRFTSSFVGDEMCGNIWHLREAREDPPRSERIPHNIPLRGHRGGECGAGIECEGATMNPLALDARQRARAANTPGWMPIVVCPSLDPKIEE